MNNGRVVGIDLGVKNLLTFSNGEVKDKLQMKKLENRIKKEQKNLSRKKFKSKNWYKNKIRIRKLHNKMKNKRQGYIHQLTKNIVRNFDTIVIEDLKTKNLMKRTAKGEKNKPTLSKNIAHSAWYEIKRQLEYKTKWYKKNLIKVNPYNTSKKCNKCGHIFKELKSKDRTWTCSNCNTTHNRDINVAKNILEKATI